MKKRMSAFSVVLAVLAAPAFGKASPATRTCARPTAPGNPAKAISTDTLRGV